MPVTGYLLITVWVIESTEDDDNKTVVDLIYEFTNFVLYNKSNVIAVLMNIKYKF